VRILVRRLNGFGAAMAVASRLVTVTSAVQLSATAKRSGATCSVAGEIRAANGPVAHAALVAFVGDEPRHAMTSDARGNFSGTFDCPQDGRLAPRAVDIRYPPDREGLASAEIRLTLPVAAESAGGVLAFCVFGAGLLFAALWGIGRLRGVFRRASTPAPSSADATIDRPKPPIVGVTLGPSRSMFGARSTLIGGVVVDAVTGAPVAAASLVVTANSPTSAENTQGGAPHVIPVDANGRFTFDAASAASLRLTFQAPDYVPTTIDLHSPHRGAYRTMCVSLLSVREAIRDLYVQGSTRLGVSRARILRASPHEIAAAVETPAVEPIAAYASAFEQLFFAAGPRNADDHRRFETHVARLPDLAPTERDRLPPLRPVGASHDP
jgi:hypothetical protein